ncbi:ABC transporter permease [Uliginosibacterium sp. sgz301328]|uniref:ABC transporter permease n=1 Tax=Uliginosibacterium sp. sgz301328 TaxID=3243764 RepID=UPI00359EE686
MQPAVRSLAADVGAAEALIAAPGGVAQWTSPTRLAWPALSRVLRRLEGLGLPIAVLVLWAIAARQAWLPTQILPPPERVWEVLVDGLAGGDLLHALGVSLMRVLEGCLIGSALGLAFGVLLASSRVSEVLLYPTFKALAQIPTIGWLPLLMLVFGLEDALKLVIIAKSSFIPMAFNAFEGVRAIPDSLTEVGTVLRLNLRQRLLRLVLPGSLPALFTGQRLAISHAWKAMVAVEILVSTDGIGATMLAGRQFFQLDVVMACIVVIGVTGFLIDRAFVFVERRALRWRVAGNVEDRS